MCLYSFQLPLGSSGQPPAVCYSQVLVTPSGLGAGATSQCCQVLGTSSSLIGFTGQELTPSHLCQGPLRWHSDKESACQYRRHGFDPWVGKIPWRRNWQPTPVFQPGKRSHGQRSLVGYSLWGCKESDTTEHTHTHTHTHILIFHMLEHLEEKTKATKEAKEGS